jgi:hypothetical protein
MKLRTLFLVLLISLTVLNAQTNYTYEDYINDSLRIVKPKLIRPQIRIDSRVSFFENQTINIYGYDAGILAKDKLRLALGYYRINNDLPAKKEIDGVNTNISLVVNCGSLNTEMIFYNSRYFSAGFPFELGFGEYDLKYETAEGRKFISKKSGYLGFANFGLSLTFKPIRFIGLKGMAGYRKSLYPNEREFGFNGLFTSIGLNVDVREIIKDVQLYKLKKRYYRESFNGFETFVDLLID